jgi:AbiV family abortive infection protein
MAEDPIDRNLVAQLGRIAADNAVQLAEEADLLDENGHGARAFALTVLAAEELGKSFICMLTETHAHDPRDWDPFKMMVAGQGRHQTKILAALFLMQRALDLSGQPVNRFAHALDDLVADDLEAAKVRAFYVDIEGGQVATPGRVAGRRLVACPLRFSPMPGRFGRCHLSVQSRSDVRLPTGLDS